MEEISKATSTAYACYNKSESDRKISSSGGIYSILARVVIQNGGWFMPLVMQVQM